jgi:hypothetical protein
MTDSPIPISGLMLRALREALAKGKTTLDPGYATVLLTPAQRAQLDTARAERGRVWLHVFIEPDTRAASLERPLSDTLQKSEGV